MKKRGENRVLESFSKINATPEYVAKNEIVVHAISEIVKNKELNIVSKEQSLQWLNRYKHIFRNFADRSPIFYPTLKDFFELYTSIKRHIECLELNNQILTALADFNEVDLETEKTLLKWLVTYEGLNHNLPYFKESNNKEYVILSEEHNLSIEASDFKNTLEFKDIYSEYYINIAVKFKANFTSGKGLSDSDEVRILLDQ